MQALKMLAAAFGAMAVTVLAAPTGDRADAVSETDAVPLNVKYSTVST